MLLQLERMIMIWVHFGKSLLPAHHTQQAFTSSKSTMETLEKVVKYVES